MTLFLRNYLAENLWFSAKDVLEQQLLIARTLIFGETSQISTYLKRLNGESYLIRRNNGYRVQYQIAEKLLLEYPSIDNSRFINLIKSTLY